MRKLILRVLINSLGFYLASLLLPLIRLDSLPAALFAGAVLALANILVRPVLVIIALPINILTFGLLTLVINTLMVMLADGLTAGLYIPGFWLSFAAALLITVINVPLKTMVSAAG
ncbi:MAG: phage holin family protein [Eubacteriales bacterium]